MNDINLPDPCAGYEPDLIELHEGTLLHAQAQRVRAHLGACARCSGWLARYAALDLELAGALPRPVLSVDFGARLRIRINGLAAAAPRGDRRAAAEREHDLMILELRREARQRAFLGGAAAAVVAVGGMALAVTLRSEAATLLQGFDARILIAAANALGAVAVLGALAWSATRGALPGLRLRG
jgi:hypothetical protein